ncbi:MAG TPA: mannose-1-phosphate guanyltransferase, partial [Hyphomonadaceae bacterium]|nr:mannose-1-phosphate guanyltransferase [Hyphomonadaceae bacterium]
EALILLLPADHLIADRAAFLAAVVRAAPFARQRVITFGMAPDRPATGYGYIRSGEPLGDGVLAIAAFREKPDADTARDYLTEGGYYWNAGMFLFHPQVMFEEFAASSDIRDGALAALHTARRTGAEIFLDAAAFAATPSLPLDTALMEKTARGAVVPCAIGWADVGAWDEVWCHSNKDDQGNVRHGAVVAIDAANNLIRAEGMKVCVAGISDLIVIATPEAVIVLPRDRAQDVKALRELATRVA